MENSANMDLNFLLFSVNSTSTASLETDAHRRVTPRSSALDARGLLSLVVGFPWDGWSFGQWRLPNVLTTSALKTVLFKHIVPLYQTSSELSEFRASWVSSGGRRENCVGTRCWAHFLTYTSRGRDRVTLYFLVQVIRSYLIAPLRWALNNVTRLLWDL